MTAFHRSTRWRSASLEMRVAAWVPAFVALLGQRARYWAHLLHREDVAS